MLAIPCSFHNSQSNRKQRKPSFVKQPTLSIQDSKQLFGQALVHKKKGGGAKFSQIQGLSQPKMNWKTINGNIKRLKAKCTHWVPVKVTDGFISKQPLKI